MDKSCEWAGKEKNVKRKDNVKKDLSVAARE
jgi:hypothetical protein